MKIKIPSYIKVTLKLLLTTLAIYLVFKKIDVTRFLQIIKDATPVYLLIAFVLFVLSKIVSAFRFNIFLQHAGVQISQIFNLKLYWLGMYYNLFLPGGTGGDGYKIYFLNKTTNVKTKEILLSVVLDRVTGLLALFCLALNLGYFVPHFFNFWFLLWLAIPVVILIFYIINYFFFKKYIGSFKITNVQSFIVQIAQVFCAYFILKALQVDMFFGRYLFVFLVSSIVATVPFTIGGIGAREITFILASQYLGLELETAIGLSAIFFCITALVSLFGMYYSFNLSFEKVNDKLYKYSPEMT